MVYSSLPQSDDVIEWRALIEKKPKNAKLAARFSLLLHSKLNINNDSDKDNNNKLQHKNDTLPLPEHEKDPMYWAQKAVEMAPQKPFGYAALSVLYPQGHVRRLQNLETAVQRLREMKDKGMFRTTWIDLSVRLLTETRSEERVRVRGKIGKASALHPNKRPLDSSEETLYGKISVALNEYWSTASSTSPSSSSIQAEMEFVGQREYRLGLFFRKMEPAKTTRPRSQAHFRRVLQYLPQEHTQWSMARFWIATLTDGDIGSNSGGFCLSTTTETSLDRCPKDYVVGLYSTFAERFDSLLVEQLAYQTPTLLRKLLDSHRRSNRSPFVRMLDLGCGTGLSGLAFADCSKRLEGIDLSPEMIAKAHERKCYDKLMVGDVLDLFVDDENDKSSSYVNVSLVVACDVFCYIGDLKPIFDRVYQALESGGFFAFSTELLLPPSPLHSVDVNFRLHSCARFAHSQRYIEQLAKEAGYGTAVAMQQAVIRKNQGQDVQGLLTILRKD